MGKILVVEDNPDNMAVVRFFLQSEGHTIVVAATGLEAIRIAHQEMPDLILMDMAIPELDGWAASRKLKDDPVTRQIPIIALTAYTLPKDQERAMASGCDSFIPKPIHLNDLQSAIDGFLAGKKA